MIPRPKLKTPLDNGALEKRKVWWAKEDLNLHELALTSS
jgi:hypothetical protein